jgi:nucleoside phosphorylase
MSLSHQSSNVLNTVDKETQNLPCAVILTAIPEEYKAIRAYLTDIQGIEHKGTLYEAGRFSSNKVLWKVGIVKIDVGNDSAAFEAERAIDCFKPTIAMFVGVAGGIKDVQLGDVVVATKVYGYESGKQEEDFKSRPEVGNSDYGLKNVAQHIIATQEKWWEPLVKLGSAEPEPRAFVGPIAAGNKVVASTYSALYKFLRKTYNDALAVEMEGIGFMKAIQANTQVAAIIVRGISDLIDKKSEADKAGSQQIAARNASAFAFRILIKQGEILSQRKVEELQGKRQEKVRQLEQLEGEIEEEKARLPEVSEHCRQAADWLNTFRHDLAQNAGKHALAKIRGKNYSPEEVDNFLWEIEKLLELIYYCALTTSLVFLDGLNIRLTLPITAYVKALKYIKESQLSADPALSNATAEIRGCLEYLIDKLEHRK